MDKVITARFFRVATADGTPPLHQIFKSVRELPIEDRLVEVQSSLVRLERLEPVKGSSPLFGDFVRLQVENKPGMASKSTAEKALDLPSGHGLTHTAAFGYDSKRSILCLQANRSGLSTRNLSTYLSTFVEKGGYSFMPLVRTGTLKRLTQVNVRTLRIKLGSPDDLSDLDDDTRTTKDNLKHMHDTFGGRFVETIISVGHSKRHLHQSRTRKLLRWFQKNAAEGAGDIQTLKISGYGDADEGRTRVALDLLEDLISYEDHLVLPDDDAEKNFAGRSAFIRRAFSANEADLAAYKET